MDLTPNQRRLKAIINIDNTIPVFLRRGREDTFYDLPGGMLEEGETPQQALAREMKEELSITVTVGEKISERLHPYKPLAEVGARYVFYGCEYVSGEAENCLSEEHLELKHVSPHEAIELLKNRIDDDVEKYLLNLANS